MKIIGNSQLRKLHEEGIIKGNGTLSSPYVLSGIKFSAYGGPYALCLENISTPLIVENCTFTLGFWTELPNSSGAGISLYKCKNVILRNDTVYYSLSGVYCYDDENVSIEGLSIDGCIYGIYVANSQHLSIAGCVIRSGERGMDVSSSKYINVTCSIFAYSEFGIEIEQESSYFNVSFSAFAFDIVGLYIMSLSHGKVTNSLFYECRTGVCGIGAKYLEVVSSEFYKCWAYAVAFYKPSSHNLVYGNNFLYNHGSNGTYHMYAVQAFDNTKSDMYNTTIGNFWLDWANSINKTAGEILPEPYLLPGGTFRKDYRPLSTPLNLSVPKASEVLKAISQLSPVKLNPDFTYSFTVPPSVNKRAKGRSDILLYVISGVSCAVVAASVASGIMLYLSKRKSRKS